MKTLDNIPRLSGVTPEVFTRDYIRKQAPVILTDLLDGQPIRRLNSAARLRAELGDVPVRIAEEYFTAARRQRSLHDGSKSTMITIAEYLALAPDDPRRKLLCAEDKVPRGLAQRVDPPEHAGYNSHLPEGDVLAFFFLGHAGHYAHLHFDGDYRHVLLFQMFGKKRITLLRPQCARMLNPIENIATLHLERMTPDEKLAFYRYTDARDAVLGPGEAIYIPVGFWHYVEYTTLAASLCFRFGRNRYTTLLASCLHPSWHVQALAVALADARRITAAGRRAFAAVERATKRRYLSPLEKHTHLAQLTADLHAELDPKAALREHWLPQSEMIDRSLQARLASGRTPYTNASEGGSRLG